MVMVMQKQGHMLWLQGSKIKEVCIAFCMVFASIGYHCILYHLVTLYCLSLYTSFCFTIFRFTYVYWHKHHNQLTTITVHILSRCLSIWPPQHDVALLLLPEPRETSIVNHLRKLMIDIDHHLISSSEMILRCFFGREVTNWGSGPYLELVLNLEAVVAMPLAQQRNIIT